MKKMLFAAALLMTVAFSGTASAVTVNIGSQAGTFDISPLLTIVNSAVSADLNGTISPRTSVTFTYTLTSASNTDQYGPANLFGWGQYNFYQNSAGKVLYTPTAGYTHYHGTTHKVALEGNPAIGPDVGEYSGPSDNGIYRSLALLTSAAGISDGGLSGTFTLTNTSNAIASYLTNFKLQVGGLQAASYTYQVTPLSAVPLPAALPLFGGAMMVLGAFRFKKKRS